VGVKGTWLLVEVKSPGKKLNKLQAEFFSQAVGPVHIARDIDDVAGIVFSVES